MRISQWRIRNLRIGKLSSLPATLLGGYLLLGGCLVQSDPPAGDTPGEQNPAVDDDTDMPGTPDGSGSLVSSSDGMASVDVPMGTDTSGMSVTLLPANPNVVLPLGTETPSPEYGFEPYDTLLPSVGTFTLPAAQGLDLLVLLRRDDDVDLDYDIVPTILEAAGTSASFSATQFGAYRFAKTQDPELFFNARVLLSLSDSPNCAGCHGGVGGTTPKFLGGIDPYDTITNLAPEIPLNGNLPDSYIDPANPAQSHLLLFAKSQEHPGPAPSAAQEALILEWVAIEL